MEQLSGLTASAFAKADPAPDSDFYAWPRFVAHIDDGAIAEVTRTYRAMLQPGGAILDLMSSWISHLPDDVEYETVTGHGMNAAELAANPRLTSWFVQDLNTDPVLPLDTSSFNAACLCAAVQYLQRPVEVFRDILRVLRPGAPCIVSFSNRCFPTKAVAIWQSLSGQAQHQPDWDTQAGKVPGKPGTMTVHGRSRSALVGAYLLDAGFTNLGQRSHLPNGSDPLWTVIGYAP
jgi:hypothetical protein